MTGRKSRYKNVSSDIGNIDGAGKKDWVVVEGRRYDRLTKSHQLVRQSLSRDYEQGKEETIEEPKVELANEVRYSFKHEDPAMTKARPTPTGVESRTKSEFDNTSPERTSEIQSSEILAGSHLRDEVIRNLIQKPGADLTFEEALILIAGTQYVGDNRREQIYDSLEQYASSSSHLTSSGKDTSSITHPAEHSGSVSWVEVRETAAAFVSEYKSLFERFPGKSSERKREHLKSLLRDEFCQRSTS